MSQPVPQQSVTFSPTLFMSPEPEGVERELREAFVEQFLHDHNALQAAMRLGFAQPYAQTYAKQFMNEPFVQRLIRSATEALGNTDPEKLKGAVIGGLLREANFHGMDSSHSARVSSLGKLSTILGLDSTTTEINVNHKGGVMLVPAIANVEDWEQAALQSQQALVDVSAESS